MLGSTPAVAKPADNFRALAFHTDHRLTLEEPGPRGNSKCSGVMAPSNISKSQVGADQGTRNLLDTPSDPWL